MKTIKINTKSRNIKKLKTSQRGRGQIEKSKYYYLSKTVDTEDAAHEELNLYSDKKIEEMLADAELNEYILPNKVVAVTRKEDDGCTIITTLNFASSEYVTEFLTDPIIKEFGRAKKEYNKQHNISTKTEAVNE